MANTQTLNMYFDLTKAPSKKHGQFADDDALGHRSKVWIDQAKKAISYKHLPVKFSDNVAISVHMGTQLPAPLDYLDIKGVCLRITLVLWRKTGMNDATFDSPFTENNMAGGQVKTVFDQPYSKGQLVNGSASLLLGTPQNNSGVVGGTDSYMFVVVVALNVQDNLGVPQTFTASQDPQMDVSL